MASDYEVTHVKSLQTKKNKKLSSKRVVSGSLQRADMANCDKPQLYFDKKTGKNRCENCGGLWEWHD